MKRQAVIDVLIEHDIDSIIQNHPERIIAEILEMGCTGYCDYTNKELQDFYNDLFEEMNREDDTPITIEEDI